MTSRDRTPMLALPEKRPAPTLSDRLYVLAFGAIGWPWLLKSLYGGSGRARQALLKDLALPEDALPNLGSWKADVGFLRLIADHIRQERPEQVVELGAGATTLVAAQALKLNGKGRLTTFEQHAGFAETTQTWLGESGLAANIIHAPLGPSPSGWPGSWYAVSDLPEAIDMLIIDGPPWSVHPYVRGAAETLFSRIGGGGTILLDDAARPGERVVAKRWRARWPDFDFKLDFSGSKGTLIGRRRATS
jgi:predicted O-methyltransferase YrrM